MLINRNDFLVALQMLQPVVGGTSFLSMNECVHFYDGKILGFSTGTKYVASLPFSLDGISCSVHFKELFEVLKKMKTTEIDVSIEDGHFLIKAGKARCGIRVFDRKDMIPYDVIKPCEEAEMHQVFPSFFDALKCVSFCAADPSEYSDMINIQVKDGDVRAINGAQAIIVDLPKDEPALDCYFPAESVPIIAHYDFTKMGITKSYFVFADDSGFMFCVQRNTYNCFPDFSVFMDKAEQGSPFVFPLEVEDIIKKAIVFLDKGKYSDGTRKTQSVLLLIKPGKITCKGVGEYGWYEESIKTDYNGECLEFYIVPENLLAMLPNIQETKYNKSVEMVYNEGSDFKYVFMCIKRSNEDTYQEDD